MIKNYKKGFTLIELLVVIAIIGILASVVLAATNSARSKGKDAAAMSSMAQARAGAELAYSVNNSYKNLCFLTGAVTAMTGSTSAANNQTGFNKEFINSLINGQIAIGASATAGNTGYITCNSDDTNGTAYAASLKLNTGTYCIDSTGYAGTKTITGTATVCS